MMTSCCLVTLVMAMTAAGSLMAAVHKFGFVVGEVVVGGSAVVLGGRDVVGGRNVVVRRAVVVDGCAVPVDSAAVVATVVVTIRRNFNF